MSVLTGKNGTLYVGSQEVTPLANWRLVLTSHNAEYVANDTGACKKRVAGAQDSAGAFVVKAQEGGHCPVKEGELVALKLHVDATGNNYCEVPAIIDKIEVDANIGTAAIVAFVVDFSGNGPVTRHGILASAGQ